MNYSVQTEDKYFKRGVGLSIAVHVAFVLAMLFNLVFFKKPVLDLSQAIRVDMVGLPDKIDHHFLPGKAQEKPAEKPAPKADIKKPIAKLPEKEKLAPKTDPTTIDLKKTKTKQKEALEKLKKQSAIEKIKQEMKTEEQQNKIQQEATKAIAKGRVISAGNAITGLDKLEANAYLQSLDQQVKQHWALPQWLINKPYKTQIHVKFDSGGQIISRVVLTSSGQPAYDNYCLQAVDQAAPFPKVPEKFVEKFSVDGVVIGFPE